MRQYWAIAAFVFLAGCGIWSPVIRSDVIDYGDVVETTSDKFLLVNILEARDNAPLHFMEFPKVSGSLTATASLQSAIPFAPQAVGFDGGGIIDPTLTPNIGVTASPTFEVDNVDTTDFTTGTTAQIDPKFVKYWIDRGLDKRIILHMFFSSATISEKQETPESCKPGKDKRLRDARGCALDLKVEAVGDIGSCQRVLWGNVDMWGKIRGEKVEDPLACEEELFPYLSAKEREQFQVATPVRSKQQTRISFAPGI